MLSGGSSYGARTFLGAYGCRSCRDRPAARLNITRLLGGFQLVALCNYLTVSLLLPARSNVPWHSRTLHRLPTGLLMAEAHLIAQSGYRLAEHCRLANEPGTTQGSLWFRGYQSRERVLPRMCHQARE